MPQLTTFRLYLLGLGLLFGGYVALEYNRPKPVNWTPTYINKDKIPYGTYALYDQLPRLLGTDSIEAVRLPVYSQLTGLDEDEMLSLPDREEEELIDSATVSVDSAAIGSAADINEQDAAEESASEDSEGAAPPLPLRAEQANYLFINKGIQLGQPDALALLRYVARGNHAFVAAEDFSGVAKLLRDSLGFRIKESELISRKNPKGIFSLDSVEVRFTNPALAGARYRFPGPQVEQRIVVDSGRVGQSLATDAQGQAVFVRLRHGRGYFYLCTAPVAFTNYYLLRPRTTGFAAAALAYLPARHTWWDEYQKQGRQGEQSLLRVIMAHEPLQAAYYLALAAGLLLVLNAARRRQRIIPTIRPLPNTTLLFTRTVAGLYRQGSSHALIAEKKVSLFLDYLRTRFQEPNPDFSDEAFRERLAQKAGLARPRVDELLRLVNFARTAPQVTDQELLKLSRALGDFRREARR